jgi:hypothetical protein
VNFVERDQTYQSVTADQPPSAPVNYTSADTRYLVIGARRATTLSNPSGLYLAAF